MIIAELLGALAEAFAGLLMAIAQLLGSIVGIFAEFLFLLVTAGASAATERYRQRTSERRDAAKKPADKPFTRLQWAIVAAMLLVTTGMPVWYLIQHQRVQWTEKQVAALAERFADQARDKWDVALPAGALDDKDAWGRPLELTVIREDFAVLIKVRSAGPDGTDSFDDVKTMRLVTAPADKIAGGLAKRGWEVIRERVFPGPKKGDAQAEK